MKNDDTFSLTSIREEKSSVSRLGFPNSTKFPHLKTQMISKSNKFSKSLRQSSSSSSLKTSSKTLVTHELLKSISERAKQ